MSWLTNPFGSEAPGTGQAAPGPSSDAEMGLEDAKAEVIDFTAKPGPTDRRCDYKYRSQTREAHPTGGFNKYCCDPIAEDYPERGISAGHGGPPIFRCTKHVKGKKRSPTVSNTALSIVSRGMAGVLAHDGP